MVPITRSRRRPARREILKSSALAILPLALPSGNFSFLDQQPMTANGGKDPIRFPGWIRMAATISRLAQTSNPRISIISKVESLAAALLRAWAPTIRETASRLAAQPPITASCRETIGLLARRNKVLSHTYD
jgi:hypothetical protein